MEKEIDNKNGILTCVNCITGSTQSLTINNGMLEGIFETPSVNDTPLFVGPGLIDLQINGINGIDFNDPSLSEQDVIATTRYLLSNGVTTFLPTVITNSDENIFKIVQTINNACTSDPLVNDCIWGIHLEGPFISPVAGAKGAHDEKFIKAPDWELFNLYQQAAGGKIKIVTLSPEWEGSGAFIENCRKQGILVSIGHSMASSEQVAMSVRAGASLSTHLGNGIPLLIPRHPNIIWDQLAASELYTCIITDGIHIPDSFIKVVIKNKGSAAIIVSDATCFAGMEPGEYQTHIGGAVVLDANKKLSLKNSPGLLAGAAKSLPENLEYVIGNKIATLAEAWPMASTNVAVMLAKTDPAFNDKIDYVIFRRKEQKIVIEKVIKSGLVVYEKE